MIPLELSLQGVYSYRRKQTIDFRYMNAAGLSGIFGAVGSGKSTILEAISFALYGDTERLNRRDNRAYNMMNLKSNEMLIDFRFALRDDEQDVYRFECTCRRNARKFDTVSTPERKAYKLVKGEWLLLESNMAEGILNLSYENFRRTIIIPQGKFQEFLQLTGKDRSVMLQELFQLDRFDLADKAGMVEAANNAVLQELKGQLVQLGDITEEAIAAQQRELQEEERACRLAEQAHETVTGQLKALEALADLFRKIDVAQRELHTLRAREQEFAEREQGLKEYRHCLLHFRDDLRRLDEGRDALQKLKDEIERDIQALHHKQTELKVHEESHGALRLRYEHRDKLQREAEELAQVQEIRALLTQEQTAAERLAKGRVYTQGLRDTLDAARKQRKKLEVQLGEWKVAQPDTRELSDVRNWFTARKSIAEAGTEARAEVEACRKESAELEAYKAQQFAAVVRRVQPGSNVAAMTSAELEGVLDAGLYKAEKSVQALKLQREHRSALADMAANLDEGEACPVCGSEHHPKRLDAHALIEESNALEQQIAEQDEFAVYCRSHIGELRQFSRRYEALQDRQKRAVGKLEEQETRLEAHAATFRFTSFHADDEAAVENAIQLAEDLRRNIAEGEAAIAKLDAERDGYENELAKCEKGLEQLQQQATSAGAEAAALLRNLQVVDFAALATSDAEMLSARRTGLSREYAGLVQKYAQSEKELQSLHAELSSLQGRLARAQKEHQERIGAQAVLEAEVQAAIAAGGYADFGAVREILARTIDSEAEQQAIEDYRQQLHSSNARLLGLRSEAEGKRYDETVHHTCMAQRDELTQAISARNRKIGELNRDIRSMQRNLQERSALEHKLGNAAARADAIATIKGLLRGNGFVDFVSTIHLRNLCRAANERFHKLSRQRLMLELDEKNDFQVRDFLNDGQVRSIKTLSGGQMFQASLSLALALSDSIQHRSGVERSFFFLDEGFGTLDRDSLRTVFDTLKSLRKENRIVGLISHVDDLQEEIDVYLHIRNDDEEGSVVTPSWGAE